LEKSISDIINNEYKKYSFYVLENRAIPSAVDGLKPVHRKLLYSMMNEHGGKKTKIADLGGISSIGYHHGEASAMNAAINMTQKWANNAPLFEEHGNFGSRLVQESAAPRYIFASLSDNYKKYFGDEEVCPPNIEQDNPEPQHYLPIIPWALVNGISGIAVGYATTILPRSPEALRTLSNQYLEGKLDVSEIKPHFPDFRGTIEKGVNQNQWKVFGIVYKNKLSYEISELPIGYDRESYINFLNSLVDENKIQDFEDACSQDGFLFIIKATRDQCSKIDKNPISFFKLEKSFTENITTLDQYGKLKLFETALDLLKWFCDYRLIKFNDKILFRKSSISYDIEFLKDKKRFIQFVIDGMIDFRNLSKDDLLQFIEDQITNKEHGKKFISIPMYECTVDSVDSLNKKIIEKENELGYWDKTTAKKEYLKALSKK
jgi:DNA gyrase/topoisomerase IV subunit A